MSIPKIKLVSWHVCGETWDGPGRAKLAERHPGLFADEESDNA